MARLPRIAPAGIPVHLIQRGNNRQTCFAAPEDYAAYLNWLKEYSIKCHVDVHAWVLMTHHVHLLCTPQEEGAISLMMQSVGRRYVQYFNHQYQRSGTLWADARMRRHRALFSAHVEENLVIEIRDGVNKGMALGNDRFNDEVEKLTGRRFRSQKVGRPVGWRKKKE